jgi:hypothetical protein
MFGKRERNKRKETEEHKGDKDTFWYRLFRDRL